MTVGLCDIGNRDPIGDLLCDCVVCCAGSALAWSVGTAAGHGLSSRGCIIYQINHGQNESMYQCPNSSSSALSTLRARAWVKARLKPARRKRARSSPDSGNAKGAVPVNVPGYKKPGPRASPHPIELHPALNHSNAHWVWSHAAAASESDCRAMRCCSRSRWRSAGRFASTAVRRSGAGRGGVSTVSAP